MVSDRRALLRSRRLRRVKLPVALLDAASPLVSGNDNADVVRASPFARSGNFLLRLASRQGKDLIAESWRGAPAASSFCSASTPEAARSAARGIDGVNR